MTEPTNAFSIPIVQAGGEKHQYLGCFELNLKRSFLGKWKLVSYSGKVIKLDESIEQDPETLAVMQSIIAVPVN